MPTEMAMNARHLLGADRKRSRYGPWVLPILSRRIASMISLSSKSTSKNTESPPSWNLTRILFASSLRSFVTSHLLEVGGCTIYGASVLT